MPLSFYGITFAPYLAMLAALVGVLQRIGRPSHARVTEGWLLFAAVGLAGMSLMLGTDLRAPTAVLATDGAILIAFGALLRRETPILLGTMGVLGGAVCGLIHLQPVPGLGILAAAALGLGALAVAAGLGRGQPESAFRFRSARAVFTAVAFLALGLVLRVGLSLAPIGTGWLAGDLRVTGFDPAGHGLVAILVLLVAAALRQPAASLLAAPAVIRGVLSICLLCGEPLDGPWTPLALSLGMLLWLGGFLAVARWSPWSGSAALDEGPSRSPEAGPALGAGGAARAGGRHLVRRGQLGIRVLAGRRRPRLRRRSAAVDRCADGTALVRLDRVVAAGPHRGARRDRVRFRARTPGRQRGPGGRRLGGRDGAAARARPGTPRRPGALLHARWGSPGVVGRQLGGRHQDRRRTGTTGPGGRRGARWPPRHC